MLDTIEYLLAKFQYSIQVSDKLESSIGTQAINYSVNIGKTERKY